MFVSLKNQKRKTGSVPEAESQEREQGPRQDPYLTTQPEATLGLVASCLNVSK